MKEVETQREIIQEITNQLDKITHQEIIVNKKSFLNSF